MNDRLLGGFEQLVLLALLHLEDESAYAVPLRQLLQERAGRRVSRGALYTVLERLETKGYVSSEMGESTSARGGRPKRLFSVTPLGVAALRLSKETLTELWEGLESVLGGAR